MPSGSLAITPIVGYIRSLNPKSILDLGIGTGKWGFLLREQTDLAAGIVDRTQWEHRILGVARFIVVTTPTTYFPQGAEDLIEDPVRANAALEQHRSWWPRSSFEVVAKTNICRMRTTVMRPARVVVLARQPIPRLPRVRSGPKLAVRSALVPDERWYRLRGEAGPRLTWAAWVDDKSAAYA